MIQVGEDISLAGLIDNIHTIEALVLEGRSGYSIARIPWCWEGNPVAFSYLAGVICRVWDLSDISGNHTSELTLSLKIS